MVSKKLVLACAGAVGLVTAWEAQAAVANEIYTDASVTAPVDLTHMHVLYTSNVSVVQTDNTTILPTPIRFANYEAGSVTVTGYTASTAGAFALNFQDPTVTLADGETDDGAAHLLTLVGVNSANQLVVGIDSTSPANFGTIFGTNSYATVLNAVESDSDATLAGLIAPPVGNVLVGTLAFGPGTFGPDNNGIFEFDTFTDETTGTLLVDDAGAAITGTIEVPEPMTAGLVGVPMLALALGRRKRKA